MSNSDSTFDVKGREMVEYQQENREQPQVDWDEVAFKVAVGSVPIGRVDMEYLKAQGFGAIMDLCRDFPDEERLAVELGMEYFGTFIVDLTPPNQGQFKMGVEWLDKQVKMGRRVYVHCHAGLSRSPTMVAAYMVSLGIGSSLALSMVRKKRDTQFISTAQEEAVREFEKSYRRQSCPPSNSQKPTCPTGIAGESHGTSTSPTISSASRTSSKPKRRSRTARQRTSSSAS